MRAFLGRDPHQLQQAGFGGAIGGDARLGFQRRCRGRDDNRAALGVGAHQRHHRAHGEERAVKIGGHHAPPILKGHVGHRGGEGDAGAVVPVHKYTSYDVAVDAAFQVSVAVL